MPVTIAQTTDIPGLVTLINSAYRGESSKKGWTSEADLLVGELRTDIPTLTQLMNKPGVTMLKYMTEEGSLDGSVFLEKQERGLYLGMLSVSPLRQAGGIGRQLMQAAEQFASQQHCACIFMSVISVRHELISWYERLGYTRTGEKKPMLADNRFGVPTQPLEFITLKKDM